MQRARLAAFAISGFWAAVAGGLFAYSQGVVETQAFSPSISLLILVIVVIGGVTSLPGAILGAVWIGVLKYGGFNQHVQELASGTGVLILLWVLPGGLAQVFYGVRDSALRWVAQRRGIVVPSLVADVREAEPGIGTQRAIVPTEATEALLDAPVITEVEVRQTEPEVVPT